MAEPTWDRRERVLLEAVVKREGNGEQLNREILAAATGLDVHDAGIGLRALVDAGYISGFDAGVEDDLPYYFIEAPTERGRRATGQWPVDDVYDALVRMIEHRVESTVDEVEKSRLRSFLDGVRAGGRDVVVDVLAAVATRQLGL